MAADAMGLPGGAVDQFDLLRRSLVCLATKNYDNPRLSPLESVPDELATITQWLTDHGLGVRRFTQLHPDLAGDPTKKQVRDALEDPPDTTGWRDGDAVVVYVTGHGIRKEHAHWLCLKGTDPARPRGTALRTADLVGWLAETQVEHLMVLVDVCHAGAAAGEVADFDLDLPPSWIALGSVTASQQAKVEGLTGAIASFLKELRAPEGAKYDHGPYLKVQDFLSGLQERLPGQRLAVLSPGLPNLSDVSPCLPNPRWTPSQGAQVAPARRGVALRPEDLASHWGPRSRGAASDTDPGWLFTGRAALMRRLIAAAMGDAGVLVLAGGAGSGKSAALARLVTLADPGFRDTHDNWLTNIPSEVMPPVECVQAAVHAKGLTPDRVLSEMCTLLEVPPPTSRGIPTRRELLASWSTWLAGRPAPLTVVIDALDESTNPADLVDGILARLHEGPGGRQLRLILGVRSPSHDRPDEPTDPNRAAIADRAARLPGATRINVDDEPWWESGDLVDYAASVLTFPANSPYSHQQAPDGATRTVADLIAGRARRSFLVTRLAAANLADRPERVDPDDANWLVAVDDGVVGVFRADLHQELDNPEQVLRALHLMRALAFSFGRGLPWNRIWPAVANAVADDPDVYRPDQTPPTYGDTDIAWLLDTRLAGYLVSDWEDDTTVYRLFHDSLTNVLRDQWTDLRLPSTYQP